MKTTLLKLLLLLLSTTLLSSTNSVLLKLDTKGHTSRIEDVIITKNKDIITASNDKTIRVWNSKTGVEKRKILGQIASGSEGKIYAIALSPNEQYLAVGGYMGSYTRNKKREDEEAFKIRIYSYLTGKLLKVLKSHTNGVLDLAFSNDNRYLISGSFDKTAKIWDIKNEFKLKDTIVLHTNDVEAVKIIKKRANYYAITAGYDKKIALYDIQKRKVIKNDKSDYKLKYLAINKELEHIAVCGKGREILIYDYDLNLVKRVKTETKSSGLSYSKNGELLIAGAGASPLTINIYKAKQNYKKKINFKKHTNLTKAVGFLDANTAVSAGGNNNEIYIWDINTAKVKKKIVGVGRRIWSVGIDGNNVAWGNKIISDTQLKNHTGKLQKSINLKTLKVKNTTHQNFKRINTTNQNYSLKHSRGGDYGYHDAVLEIREDGNLKQKILKDAITGFRHRYYGWYKDFIISAGNEGQLKVYNKQGKEVASLIGHTGEIWSIALDGDRLVSGSSDQTINIWDLSSLGDESKLYPIISLFISNDNEYVAWTKEGFFNASKNGAKYIGYHINQGSYKEALYVSVNELYNTFYRPDLIKKVLDGENLDTYAKNININKLLKNGVAPEVHILTKSQITTKENLDLKLQVCSRSGGYDNLTLLINDIAVSIIDTSRALKLKKKSKRDDCFIYNQSISLIDGKNEIGFKATNKAGNIESKVDEIEVTFNDTQNRNKLKSKLLKISGKQNINDLHILAIAVNNYKDNELKLKYSLNDATQMLKTIQKVAKPLFNKIHTYELFDEEVTKDNLKKRFENIKSSREDVFILYIAGHGITDEYNGKYYYIPYDYTNKDDELAVQTQGISQKDFMIGLSNIKALKSLVLLDTCNSGSFVEASVQETTTNRLAKATGRATISASSKSQVALEGFNEHGVFTYTLLEALNGQGYGTNNKITINELSEHVGEILPNRTYKKWGYKQIPQSSMYGMDFNIGFLLDK